MEGLLPQITLSFHSPLLTLQPSHLQGFLLVFDIFSCLQHFLVFSIFLSPAFFLSSAHFLPSKYFLPSTYFLPSKLPLYQRIFICQHPKNLAHSRFNPNFLTYSPYILHMIKYTYKVNRQKTPKIIFLFCMFFSIHPLPRMADNLYAR